MKEKLKKKVLFISFWVWSNKNPEGIVAQKILKGLEETVEEVNVITSQKFEGYNFLKDTYIFNNYSNKFQNIFNKILSKLIGCSNIFFIIKSLKYISKNKEKMNYDIVISRSEPIATHIITLYLRWKRKDKNTKYIFSFSDPGYLNPYLEKNDILKKIFYYLIERKIIKTNEIITFTNQYLADLYIKKYEIVAKNIFILFNPIIKKEIINTNSEYKSEEKSKIKFCYTGTLTKERNLKLLLEYFIFLKKQNLNPEITVVGGMGTLTYNKIFGKKLTSYLLKRKKDRILKDWKKNNLIECINILPFMNRDNLANYIKEEIDILVNIDANLGDFNIFLSSKIVDYISYRKPILNITNEGASVDFLEDFGIKYYLSYKEKNFKILNTNNIEDLRPRIFNIGKYESSELIKKLIKKLEER